MTQDNILQTRFSTTRRKHPFEGEPKDLTSAIKKEKKFLKLIENKADYFIDTTDFTPQDLASEIETALFSKSSTKKACCNSHKFWF